MPSSPTPLLKLEDQATGEGLNVWGDKNDANFVLLEEAIAGVQAKSLTGNVTLTSTNYVSNEYRHSTLVFTDGGLSSAPTVTVPAVEKNWIVHNKGSTYNINISCGGTAAVVKPGEVRIVYCDGTACFTDRNTDQQTVAGIAANVTTVAGISGNVTTVAGISANVTTVAGISANVTTVATNNANVSTVAGISANVTTVAGISSAVSTVATNSANVSTVAGSISNVNTVAGISANVTTVAGNNTNVSTVATNISAVNTVAANIADVQDAAALFGDVVQGPGSSTDGHLAVFDGTTGQLLRSGGAPPAGSSAVLLSVTTISTAVSEVIVSSGLTNTTYKAFTLRMDRMRHGAGAADKIEIAYSSDGISYTVASYDRVIRNTGGTINTTTGSVHLSGNDVASGVEASAIAEFAIGGQMFVYGNGGGSMSFMTLSTLPSNTTHLRLKCPTANLTGGRIALIGHKDS